MRGRVGATILLAMALSGCDTKVTQVSVACRPAGQLAEPSHWYYASKVDPSLISLVVPAIDITLHYTGADPRVAPPVTTYFYRESGATLRVVSSGTATMPPKGTFTYHLDAGGYIRALDHSGRGEAETLTLFIEVDGSYFSAPLSPGACRRWTDHHLDVAKAEKVPDLRDKHPVNIGASDWISISALPTAVKRTEGQEVSTYAFFSAPIALTETKNETSVPDDVTKQMAEVGVTAATPTYPLAGEPPPAPSRAPSASKGG